MKTVLKNSLIRRAIYSAIVGTLAISALPVFAETAPSARMLKGLGTVSKQTGQVAPTGDHLPIVLGNFISIFISALGVVMLVYLLWGGYTWMMAQGEEKQVSRAKDMIKNAIIGMVIVSLAFSISGFVIDRVASVVSPASKESTGESGY